MCGAEGEAKKHCRRPTENKYGCLARRTFDNTVGHSGIKSRQTIHSSQYKSFFEA